MKFIHLLLVLLPLLISCTDDSITPGTETTVLSLISDEDRRPLVHFTPPQNWMNDPNGMVYYKGEYHLFYQYHPGGTKWGPMHWGHAVSTDLLNWTDRPVALFPDEHGTIFSGSIVVDAANTTGFKSGSEDPLVAIYTSAGAKQTQSIAYSNDRGTTWVKYPGNPVLPNPGINDFRDPKVIWHESTGKWIMSLATGREISFYSSTNLKEWTLESVFGKGLGAQGGVWECPDLFPMKVENSSETKWVLLVSLNPGGPNGGSATQYFAGDFDGSVFTPEATTVSWVDYGTDNYAGVTFANIPPADGRRIMIGWMSNWVYAELVPTVAWRSTMTLPRELTLVKHNDRHQLISTPVAELSNYAGTAEMVAVRNNQVIENHETILSGSYVMDFSVPFASGDSLSITIGNAIEKFTILFDGMNNKVSLDRSKSGPNTFHQFFNAVQRAGLGDAADTKNLDVKLVVDQTSVELFWNSGKDQMTALFFPKYRYNQLKFSWTSDKSVLSEVKLVPLKKSVRK